MNLTRAAVLGTAISVGVAVVAAVLSATDAALAAVAVAIAGVLACLVLWGRALTSAVDDVQRRADRARAAARRTMKGQTALGRALQQTQTSVQGLSRELIEVRNIMHRAPGLTAEFVRVYDRLVDHSHPMPEAGGWAATPSTLLWMLDQVGSTSVATVVECGSGSSTVWLATALQRRGGEGRVVALESSYEYAQQTRAELDRLGLGERATVLHAPLVETSLPGRKPQPWFDVAELDPALRIDLLFVDGPPGSTAPEARYPAFPVLADRLSSGAIVILDDMGRPEEERIAELWCSEVHSGRTLERTRVVDRSAVFVSREA